MKVRFLLSFLFVIFFINSTYALVQWHPAGEISPGMFGNNISIGDYTFPQNLFVDNFLVTPVIYDMNNNSYFIVPSGNSKFGSIVTTSDVTIGGKLNMTGSQIKDLGNPASSTDALNLGYADARYVNAAGDTMTGNLNMNNHKVTSVANPSSSGDALNLGYADGRYVNAAGDTMSGDLNLGGHSISGVNQLTASKFVDRDNSGYYVDPSSTSKVNTMWVTGDLLVQGKISNVNVVNLNMNGSLIPTIDNSFDIGGSSYRWRNGYFSGSLSASTIYQNGNRVVDTVNAGGGMSAARSGGTVTISHADTSSQSSVSNSQTTVIQSVNLDTYGHVTKLTSVNLANYFLTQSAADNRYLKLSGGTMSGDINMNSHSITNVANPSSSGDALNLGYADGRYLKLSGGTMSGSINMNSHSLSNVGLIDASEIDVSNIQVVNSIYGPVSVNGQEPVPFGSNVDMKGNHITNVANASSSGDALNLGYADSRYVNTAGDTMSGDLSMGGHSITSLANPSASSDAATKSYVDGKHLSCEEVAGSTGTKVGGTAGNWYTVSTVTCPSGYTLTSCNAYLDGPSGAYMEPGDDDMIEADGSIGQCVARCTELTVGGLDGFECGGYALAMCCKIV